MDDEAPERVPVVLTVSDQTELPSLAQWLAAEPDMQVQLVSQATGPGDLGAVEESLHVETRTSALVSAIRVLPAFMRSRRAGLRITVTVEGQAFALESTNIDQVLPVLQRLLDETTQQFSPPPGPPLDDDTYES